MPFTTYGAKNLLDHFFGVDVWDVPTICIGLSTADPGMEGDGLAEPSGNGYARVELGESSGGGWETSVDADSSGASFHAYISNDSVIQFPTPSGSWGTVSHVCLFDAPSGGNLLAYLELVDSQSIVSGNNVRFLANQLIFRLG